MTGYVISYGSNTGGFPWGSYFLEWERITSPMGFGALLEELQEVLGITQLFISNWDFQEDGPTDEVYSYELTYAYQMPGGYGQGMMSIYRDRLINSLEELRHAEKCVREQNGLDRVVLISCKRYPFVSAEARAELAAQWARDKQPTLPYGVA